MVSNSVRTRRRHCPHTHLRGIYGDEINATPGGRRLQCMDCYSYLDGAVELASARRDEPCQIHQFHGRKQVLPSPAAVTREHADDAPSELRAASQSLPWLGPGPKGGAGNSGARA